MIKKLKVNLKNAFVNSAKALSIMIGMLLALVAYSPVIIPLARYTVKYICWFWNLLP